jgi:hypothetical protein
LRKKLRVLPQAIDQSLVALDDLGRFADRSAAVPPAASGNTLGENAEAVADPAFGVAGAGALGSSEMTTGAARLSGFGRGTFASVDAGLSAKADNFQTAG